MELYPSLKPLPEPPHEKLQERPPKGQVRVSTYDRARFAEAFKRPKAKE